MKLKVSVREMLEYMSKLHQPKQPKFDFKITESEVREPEPVRRFVRFGSWKTPIERNSQY